ncbi:hypothetical protein NX059_004433 [Plenodomus lindquistii]|nr:hypothetical protein NX059_004433 [Plenodomus lindquistii]
MQNQDNNFELETRNPEVYEPLLGLRRGSHASASASRTLSQIPNCSGACALPNNFASIEHLSPWIPEVYPRHPRTHGWGRKFSDRDVALALIQLLSGSVLLFNLIVTTYVLKKTGIKGNIADIIRPERNGNCATISLWNQWLHLAINALSTMLLGASNYCAQILVAPKRSEVDAAHKSRKTLDIGIQSFRNLKSMNRIRQALWVILMLSSSTLHLL